MVTDKFTPGMRATGQCPHHPGQPYYHCPACAKERQQRVGDRIVAEVSARKGLGTEALVADPAPVHITPRAQERLVAFLRDFRRKRLEGQVQAVRERVEKLPPAPDPETVTSQKYLDKLEAEAAEAGLNVEDFDVILLVYLDVTGVSGVHPKIRMAEPALIEDYERDYREYTYTPGLRAGVQLQHMNYLRGLIIDWHDRLGKAGFVIRHSKGDWSTQDR